jgi:hypothetical protein
MVSLCPAEQVFSVLATKHTKATMRRLHRGRMSDAGTSRGVPLAKRAGYVAISLREMISPHRVLGRKDAGQAEVGNSVVGTLHSTPLAKRAGYFSASAAA